MQASLQARWPQHDLAALPLSSDHGGRCGGNRTLTERSPWGEVRGCAPGPALLIGDRRPMRGHPVTQTILRRFREPNAAKRRSRQPSAARRRRTRARLSACGRFRAHGAADPASGGDFSRYVRRGGPPPPVPHRRRCGRRAVPQARIYDPRLSRLSQFGQGRQNRGIFLSRPGFPRSRRPSRRADADRAREFRAPGRRSGRRRGVLARDGGGDRGRGRRARGAARRRRPVRRHARFAENSGAVAKASAPRRRPRAEPRSHFQPSRARARSPSRACWRRSRAPITPAPRRWSRTCSRSPASTRSADAAPARSPTAFWNRRRCGRGRRSKRRSGRCWTPSWAFPAIPTRRRSSFGAWPIPPA